MSAHRGMLPEVHTTPRREPVTVTEMPGGRVVAVCSGCGVEQSLSTEQVTPMLTAIQRFVEAHAGCIYSL